jgi:hypothetical protein
VIRQAALLLIVLIIATARGGTTTYPTVTHEDFDRILKDVVRDERVDYARLRERHLAALDHYIGKLQTSSVPLRDDELARYINLYNAVMLRTVVDRYQPGWTPAADDFAVFKAPLVPLGPERISLNDLEHKIIRPQFKDPRVHAALVCAARSCPPLLPRAYRGDDLDRVLDENMKRFVLDRSRNPIHDEKKELKLSKIFEWYADDFGGREKLAEYVGRIAGEDYSGYTVSFVEYSWALNGVER